MATQLANVIYRKAKVGAVYWDAPRHVAVFEYTPEFIATGIELAPLQMPLRAGPHQYPRLHHSYRGLPGLLAESLPDTYGNVLIDEWVRRQGRKPDDFSPVERLCYIGDRGMGALEFRPGLRERASRSERVEVDRLVELASEALAAKEGLSTKLQEEEDLNDILSVGTSAGGARAKAVIAWNPSTNEVRSGQAQAPRGFQHWLLKFDGVSSAFDGIRDPQGYGRIEYAYSLMAKQAGLAMSECRIFTEGGRAHFMTRRFDRTADGGKVHLASLFGIAHMAYGTPWEHSHAYEDYLDTVVKRLDLTTDDRLEAFRRMVFNILGFNKDDHTKNFGFMMDDTGHWQLAPAYDVTYAHASGPGKWTATQQMSVSGKREAITTQDLVACGRRCGIATAPKLKGIISQVSGALANWEAHAAEAGVGDHEARQIKTALTKQAHQTAAG
jgi:serine/threonine-protein kinase HipA